MGPGERGGIVLRVLLWVVLLAILASGVLFVFVRLQEPLALGSEATVRAVGAGEGVERIELAPGATVYVATLVRNEGRMPVTIQGLGSDDDPRAPFVTTSLALGDGTTARPAAAAAFEPITIDPGEGVGIMVTYGVNPGLDCSAFTGEPGDDLALESLPLEASAYAMPFAQTLVASPPFARVSGPTRAACRAAVAPAAS
jgi:hypothetical protein